MVTVSLRVSRLNTFSCSVIIKQTFLVPWTSQTCFNIEILVKYLFYSNPVVTTSLMLNRYWLYLSLLHIISIILNKHCRNFHLKYFLLDHQCCYYYVIYFCFNIIFIINFNFTSFVRARPRLIVFNIWPFFCALFISLCKKVFTF